MSIFSSNHIVMVRVMTTQKSFQLTLERMSKCYVASTWQAPPIRARRGSGSRGAARKRSRSARSAPAADREQGSRGAPPKREQSAQGSAQGIQ